MRVRVFRSGKGDCLMITSADGRHVLVDGGVFDAYKDHWAGFVGNLRKNNESIDAVYVSHIDRDHIGGVLRMLDNEVDWRVFEYQNSLPDDLRTKKPKPPKLHRPPKIRAIWHNAFFEQVRDNALSSSGSGVDASIELISLLETTAALLAGDESGSDNYKMATRHQFLAYSVGDAIEVSRRIGDGQLDIPKNPEYGGEFMVRQDDQPRVDIGGMSATILGPTKAELEKLLEVWNEWINNTSSYLKKLIRRHEDDTRHLPPTSTEALLDIARNRAVEFSSNQTVTPPNLASLIVLLQEGEQSILLTGDADDVSIIEGCEQKGLFDDDGRMHVNVFKVPHHGAHNSYSNELVRRITADHYVFCGNGEYDNPEKDIIENYLGVLLEGREGHGPAVPPGVKFKLWFNCSETLADSENKNHWKKIDRVIERWSERFPGKFKYRYLKSGHWFNVL